MEPVELEDDVLMFLPPHDLITYAKDQPQYRPLPVARLHGDEGRVISRWTLTDDERKRIAAGEDIYIEMLTFGKPLQPIRPTVGPNDHCSMTTA